MLKEALIYRVGSLAVGYIVNYTVLGSIKTSLFLTILFLITGTIYYIIFRTVWDKYFKEENENA